LEFRGRLRIVLAERPAPATRHSFWNICG